MCMCTATVVVIILGFDKHLQVTLGKTYQHMHNTYAIFEITEDEQFQAPCNASAYMLCKLSCFLKILHTGQLYM